MFRGLIVGGIWLFSMFATWIVRGMVFFIAFWALTVLKTGLWLVFGVCVVEAPVELVVDKKRFREVLCKYPLVVAVFTSPTCAACAFYKPIFYAYAGEVLKRGGKKAEREVKFIEVDVYHLYEEALELGIMGTPTTVVFKDCKPVDGFPGAVDDATLVEILRPYVPVEVPYEFLGEYEESLAAPYL